MCVVSKLHHTCVSATLILPISWDPYGCVYTSGVTDGLCLLRRSLLPWVRSARVTGAKINYTIPKRYINSIIGQMGAWRIKRYTFL